MTEIAIAIAKLSHIFSAIFIHTEERREADGNSRERKCGEQ